MFNFLRITALVVAIGSFATTSQAWDWHPSPRGFVAVVKDGQCESLVTVFEQKTPDNFGPKGWRVAYDKGIFDNDLGDFRHDLGMAQIHAELVFYSHYFGTKNYKPTCYPPWAVPASQQRLVTPDSSCYRTSSSSADQGIDWSQQVSYEDDDVEISYDGGPY